MATRRKVLLPLEPAKADKFFKKLAEHIATSAAFDASERGEPPRCHPSTRVSLLNTLSSRTASPPTTSASRLFIIYGSAGSGKTAILQSFAEKTSEEENLAASFFFRYDDPKRNIKNHLIPTLVYDLTISVPDLKLYILSAFSKYPNIVDKDIATQIQVLLLDPIHAVLEVPPAVRPDPSKWPRVIIIDAIDECRSHKDSEKHQDEILGAIASKISNPPKPIRFPFHIVIATRPERPLHRALKSFPPGTAPANTQDLNKLPQTEADIATVIRSSTEDTRKDHDCFKDNPDEVWPEEKDIKELISRAGDHFVYAAVALAFISEEDGDPRERLRIVLSVDRQSLLENPLAEVDALYIMVLKNAQLVLDKALRKESKPEFDVTRALLEVMTIKLPPNLISHHDELFLFPRPRLLLFSHIRSIFNLDIMEPYHRTLAEFLNSPRRAAICKVSDREIYSSIISYCLRYMNSPNGNTNLDLYKFCANCIVTFFRKFVEAGPYADESPLPLWVNDFNGIYIASSPDNDPKMTRVDGILGVFLKQPGLDLFYSNLLRLIGRDSARSSNPAWIEFVIRSCAFYSRLISLRTEDSLHSAVGNVLGDAGRTTRTGAGRRQSAQDRLPKEMLSTLDVLDKYLAVTLSSNAKAAATYAQLTGMEALQYRKEAIHEIVGRLPG